MLTIFSTAKPLVGKPAVSQRNAIRSWASLRPEPAIVLFGDEDGVADICQELGLTHVPDVARAEFGMPLVNDMFLRAERISGSDSLCYVNSDILLMNDFARALSTVEAWSGPQPFLMVGRHREVGIDELLDFTGCWEDRIHELLGRDGERGPSLALDWFAFSRGLFGEMPPFAVGRAGWDNWMVYGARRHGARVIDASPVVNAVHQRHDYSHHPDGQSGVHTGPEAEYNVRLARREIPGPLWKFGVYDATHVLTESGVLPAWKVKGLRNWLRWEKNRIELFHPSLRPAFQMGHRILQLGHRR
jgi:hypothetical protein